MISNCGHDERGSYRGGQAGDQSRDEYYVRTWYNRPWYCVLRHPDRNTGRLIAQLARDAANNNNIGYDQNQRITFYQQLSRVNWNPSSITVPCEADCSSSTAACIIAAGHKNGNRLLQNVSPYLTTFVMRGALTSAGFQCLTASQYLTSDSYLLPGDVLLKDDAHVAINLDSGANSGSSINVSQGGTITEVVTFKPRLTSPSATDKYWVNTAYGGLNECMVINSSTGSVLPNCFSGDTEVITDKGVCEIAELDQRTVKVPTLRGWLDAHFKCYGYQNLWEVHLSNGHVYKCTADHRWPIFDESRHFERFVITKFLKKGMKLILTFKHTLVEIQSINNLHYCDFVYCAEQPETTTITLGGGELTGQCTGYAWGRFYEILGSRPSLSRGNAGDWYGYTSDGYSRGSTPQLGAVICWSKPGAAGHVAIVEQINNDGSIICSESGYSYPKYGMGIWSKQTRRPPNYHSAPYQFQGFIYNPGASGSGTNGFLMGGDLYSDLNDENDAVLREVAYLSGTNLTTSKTNIKVSIINYTTALNSLFKGMIGNGSNASIDTSQLTEIQRYIIEFFMNKGLPAVFGVAVCANVQAECNYDISAGTIDTNGLRACGMCQWNGPNAADMIAFVGSDWRTDLTGQCEYLWYDMTGRAASWLKYQLKRIYGINNDWISEIKSIPNNVEGAKRATDMFTRCYENGLWPDQQSAARQVIAAEIWNKLIVQQTTSTSDERTDNGVQKLTKEAGRITFNGHTETWYSQKVLPGGGLNIPGRYVASDGTIRDKDNYICVASDDYPKGTIVETSLGTGKVYDTGSGKNNIDIYTNW